MTVGAPFSHATAETLFVEAAGVDFAYRGPGRPIEVALVLLQRSRAGGEGRAGS
jgi:hypothetical protein